MSNDSAQPAQLVSWFRNDHKRD